MSYQDPYTAHNHNQYTDDEFNPYTSNHQVYPSYDQSGSGYGGYRDVPAETPGPSSPQRQGTSDFVNGERRRSTLNKAVPPIPMDKVRDADEVSGFERGEFSAHPGGDFKSFRRSYQGKKWTSGGRASCFGRFCCCTILIAVFLIVSILLTLALYVRPPAVSIESVGPASTGNEIQFQTDGVAINLGVNISVHNPNFFTISFSKIDAQIFYPINNNNTPIGGGTSNNINFASHQTTNFTFPFSFDYVISSDPNHAILNDLASKCGSSPPSSLTINYKITVGIRILFIPISPVVSNSFTFACPLSSSDVDNLLKLAGLLGGSTRELEADIIGRKLLGY